MPIPIIIPRLGWNMEEGTFLGWLKPDGAAIKPGDALFTLESDKSTEEIECLDAGILRIAPGGPREGDKLPVGAVIGHLVREGETVDADTPLAEPAPSLPQTPRQRTAAPQTIPFARERNEATPAISPRARRVATELGVDWTVLQGTGCTGRIRECDVRQAHSEAPQRPPARATVRQVIAERMLASHLGTAPVTLTSRADATNLVNLRSQFKTAGGDVVPSLTDFLVKLTAIALKIHPQLNGWVDGDVELLLDEVHIGIAVDTDAGLLVPVVRDVGQLGLRQLAARTRELIERARAGQLKAHEMQGGTFTLTNLGSLGIDAFTPIINQPECAILGIGAVRREPVAEGDHVVIRDRVVLSLTFDHRVVDGAPAARFLQTLVGSIENPSPWLMA